MKKLSAFLLIHLLLFASSCLCPSGGGSTTYITIHSVGGSIYSFDENGMSLYNVEIDRERLGIYIYPDSTDQRVEFAQSVVVGNQIYACEDNHYIEYTNSIESINFFTVFDFDNNHPASTNINNILQPGYNYGAILDVFDVNSMNFTDLHFKFVQPPTYDTLQFEITGRLVGGKDFKILTDMIILE
jgi:hypothetical protein